MEEKPTILDKLVARTLPKPKPKADYNIRIISVRLTKDLIDEMDQLVEQGHFMSRSELIREGIRTVIRKYRAKRALDLI